MPIADGGEGGGDFAIRTYLSGRRVKTFQDTVGRLTGVKRTNPSGGMINTYISNVTYQVGTGLLAQVTLGNTSWEEYTYDSLRLQLTAKRVKKNGLFGPVTLFEATYNYQAAAGNAGQVISSYDSQQGSLSFQYDHLGRLTSASYVTENIAYSYDRWGNLVEVARNFIPTDSYVVQTDGQGKPTNRYLTINGQPQVYDAAGHLTDDSVYVYKYDAAGRLREVYEKAVGNALRQKFWYDYAGRRVKKEERPAIGTAHWYYCVWSGDQLLLEYQTLVGTTFTPGTQPEQAAGTDTAADMRYQHWDLRSVRLVTEGSGAQVDTQSHDAFGGVMDGGASLTFFTTYEREQTGLDYAQARYYRSNHSRFTSPDSYRGSYLTGDSQSLNRFAYVGNDPINRTDPSGLEWICAEVDEEFGTGEEMYRIRWEKCNWKPESRGGNPRPCSDEGIRRIAERIQKDSTFKDDCHKMFAIMREAFNVCNSSTEAMDHLFNVLAGGGIGSSSVVFGQSGFKDIYQDRDPNSQNQVRHFIAWFYNGFFDDAPIVKMGAAWNRYQDRDNPEDLRLSNFGHYWGRRLRNVLNNPSSSGSLLDILDLLVLIEQRLCA